MSAVITAAAIVAGLGVISWIGAAVIVQALNNTFK